MAELVLGLVGPVIEVAKWVSKPIVRQFNYLCCFTSNINSLKEEAQSLGDAIAGLEGEIEIARDRRQEKPVHAVETWLTNSNNLKVEINEILDQSTNVESGCSKLVARFSLSKKAKKTTDRTKLLRGENKFEVKFQQGSPAARQKTDRKKTYEFESRNKIEEDIMTALRGGDVNMMGILGMGGLGKTTMARKLKNRALEENVCQEVVIVTVSENVDISKIQDEIGEQLGLDKLKDEKSESARSTTLHDRLSGTKRILLVLDDVWKTLELEDIGIPLDSKGCTILFTSRNRDALNQLNVQNIFRMDALSEEEAWSFFRERAGTCVDDRELNPIAKQVAKECGGLPINLAAVAAGLRDKRNAAYWKDTLRDLKRSVPDNVRFDNKTYNSLRRSYDLLESEIAKSIFLLCCLFPEDEHIPLDYLTSFCMGLRVFEDNLTNMEDARNKMLVETDFLKDRSLLLESDEKDYVRMHDVVRDVCIFIAKENGYIGKDDCAWISSSHLVGEGNLLLSESRCPNLRLLFLNRRYDSSGFEFDDAFLEGMRELRVLCIEDYSLTTLPRPTQSLGILICRYCGSIEELPSQMKGLNRLKVLDLTGCEKLQSIGRGIISSLVALEELKMFRSFKRWEAGYREERENAGAQLRELETLPNLACLEIEIDDPSLLAENMPRLSKKIDRFRISTDGYSDFPFKFSKAMKLLLNEKTRLGDWIERQFLRDAEYLCLDGIFANSMKNVVTTLGGGSDDATVLFPSLEYLRLESLPELQEICDGPISSTSFQNLGELVLINLRALTQIWKSRSVCEKNNNVPHFRNLSSITIWYCDRLRNLGQLSMAGKDCLPHLEKLHIWGCSMMEQVFLWNDDQNKTGIESQQKRHVIFPKLKKVELDELPNLTTFYQGTQGIEFPLLRKLKIKECPKMKSVDIGELVLINLRALTQIWKSGSVCENNNVPHFTNLSSVKIYSCNSLRNLVQLSMAGKDDCLPHLQQLDIAYCSMMEQVFLWNDREEAIESHVITKVFPKLKQVKLVCLPNLTTFYQGIQGIEFPLLIEMKIVECPQMKSIIGSSSADIDEDAQKHRIQLLVSAPYLKFVKIDRKYIDATKDLNGALHQQYVARQEEIFRSTVLHIQYNPFHGHAIPSSAFNRLEELTISESLFSMSLFTFSMAANLVSLIILRIGHCKEMIKVIEDEQQQERILVFPKLEELYLRDLPKLVSFCDSKCEVQLPLLREVKIVECPNMESYGLRLVATEAFTTDLTTYVGVGVDVSFDNLKKLEIESNKNPFDHHKISVSLFNGLEKLMFSSIRGSMSLFPSSVVENLVNLKVLDIDYSEILITIIEDDEEDKVVSGAEIITSVVIFPKLEELRLDWLPKLVRFCEWKCDVELPSLTKVEIEDCPNMESFSKGSVDAPNLKIVKIDFEEIDPTKDLNGAVQQHYLARQQK